MNLKVSRPFYDQAVLANKQDENSDYVEQVFTIKLRETERLWRPTLSSNDFQKLLSNLSAIRVKAVRAPHGGAETFLKDFKLGTAQKGKSNDQPNVNLYFLIYVIKQSWSENACEIR